MRIFIVGGTGAIGRQLLPLLVDHGHTVVATSRSVHKSAELSGLGAEPVMLDVLDAKATAEAIAASKPDVVLHQATALSGTFDLRNMDRFFTMTNQLRTTGTDNVLAAARAAGVERVIAQSYSGWPNERTGTGLKTEADPLDEEPTARSRQSIAAIKHVETVVPAASGLTGVVLRYGGFYGPGTSLGVGGEIVEMVRKRRFPIVGDGAGVWSFIHIRDAATATLAALDHGDAGVYNVVDDEPAPVRDWLPTLAEALGARPPRHVPAWLARFVIGATGVRMMTESRGSSNAKAKKVLDWQPAYATWREGFRTGLA